MEQSAGDCAGRANARAARIYGQGVHRSGAIRPRSTRGMGRPPYRGGEWVHPYSRGFYRSAPGRLATLCGLRDARGMNTGFFQRLLLVLAVLATAALAGEPAPVGFAMLVAAPGP